MRLCPGRIRYTTDHWNRSDWSILPGVDDIPEIEGRESC